MKAQALNEGAEIVFADVESIDFEKKELKVDGERVNAKAVIIATGAHSGKLGLPREDELRGMGVSYCAVCDGAFFRGKDVALAGGGERSMSDLKYLAGVCRKVYYVTENVVSERLPYENVVVFSLSKVSELKGSPLNGITVTCGEQSTELEVGGLFVDATLKPESALFAGKLETDIGGFIVTDGEMRTSAEKIYAAGDVRSKTLRQVVTAAGDGAIAAATALKELKKK